MFDVAALRIDFLVYFDQVVSYFPEMEADEVLRASDRFVQCRRQVYHRAWAVILADLKSVQKDRGFWYEGILYYPVMSIICNDTPEGHLINLTSKGGWPCRTC